MKRTTRKSLVNLVQLASNITVHMFEHTKLNCSPCQSFYIKLSEEKLNMSKNVIHSKTSCTCQDCYLFWPMRTTDKNGDSLTELLTCPSCGSDDIKISTETLSEIAVKHDSEKPRMSLVPQKAILEVAKVMTFGANKYGAANWKKGFDYTRLSDAALRHINAFLRKEDLDPETGINHLAHAACEILMLLEHCEDHLGRDDR